MVKNNCCIKQSEKKRWTTVKLKKNGVINNDALNDFLSNHLIIQGFPTGVPLHQMAPRIKQNSGKSEIANVRMWKGFFLNFGNYRYETWESFVSPCIIMHTFIGDYYSKIISSSRRHSNGKRRQVKITFKIIKHIFFEEWCNCNNAIRVMSCQKSRATQKSFAQPCTRRL